MNPLEDFSSFIEPTFEPIQFSNDLILATNGNTAAELDLKTPIKKLKFDLDECDKRMTTISSSNYSSLVSKFSQIETSKIILKDQVNVSIDRVNSSFDRIQTDVIQPYEEAVKLNNALKKIHTTLDLLRGASLFVFLIQQLEDLERSPESKKKDLLRLAKLHLQMSEVYHAENSNSVKSLLAIKFIRDYQPIQATKKNDLQLQCIQCMNEEFNHLSTFNVENINLQSHLVAFYILNTKEFFLVFEKATIIKQVQTSATQLSRSLQSPRNFTSIMTEIKEDAVEYFKTLTSILANCNVPQNNETVNMLVLINDNLNTTSLSELYWTRLALKFKKNIAATMARGGPIAKNLKIYFQGINNSINETFKNDVERELLIDAVSIIAGTK